MMSYHTHFLTVTLISHIHKQEYWWHSHIHVIDAQFAMEMLSYITAKPHSLPEIKREHNYFALNPRSSIRFNLGTNSHGVNTVGV